MELVAWERRINSNVSAIQRAGCASVTYKDRFVLILGGRFHDTFYLDCWSYDTSTGALNTLSIGPKDCKARAYHTATLVDGVVWVIGGSDDDAIHSNDAIWCFDVKTRVWTQPKLKGNTTLLHRTAHGACIHPTMPGCILLFGGYGSIQTNKGSSSSSEPEWLSDLVLVNTCTSTVESINSKGKGPISRAYHSFSAVGNFCVALFGRTENKNLVPAKKSVSIYDAQAGAWLDINEKDIKGTIPQVRSSHRACSVFSSGGGGGGAGGNSGSSPGGVLIFGGAPPAVPKKVDRLSDMHFLKITTTSSQTSNRRGASNSSINSKIQLEWVDCCEALAAAGMDGLYGATWPVGRGAHAQEYINGKICLFGGYCRHEKYCTDVWEGLLVVEGQQPPSTAAGGGAAGRRAQEPVCNEPAATTKWRTSRGRLENDNLLQNLLPSSAKKQRGAAGGGDGGVKNQRPPPPLPTVPAKRIKVQGGLDEVPPPTSIVNPPGTSSPTVVPGARRISALEQEVKTLRDTLLEQRTKEAALLRETSSANGVVFKLKEELKKADENWKKAGQERDDWRAKYTELQNFVKKVENDKTAADAHAAATLEKLHDAMRRCKSTSAAAEQKQKALDAAAAQNTKLQNNATALQGALDQAASETDKERQLRISIQEQNSVLQVKMTTAETEKSDLQRQIQIVNNHLDNSKVQWEAEQSRLQRELTSTKDALSAAHQELETAKRQQNSLESENTSLQQNVAVLKSRVQRLEGDLRNATVEQERQDAENKKQRDELHRLQREMDDKQRNIDTEFVAIRRALERARNANAASGSRRQ